MSPLNAIEKQEYINLYQRLLIRQWQIKSEKVYLMNNANRENNFQNANDAILTLQLYQWQVST